MEKNIENLKNKRLEQEFLNPVYDVIGKAIVATASKYNYNKYDIAKLIMAIYENDFDYLTSDNDYREQTKLLDQYFVKTYGHRVITFEMIKTIKSFEGTEDYNHLTIDIANIESIVRHNQNIKAQDTSIFSKPLEAKKYDELMTKIETEKSLRYSVAVVYEKIKSQE